MNRRTGGQTGGGMGGGGGPDVNRIGLCLIADLQQDYMPVSLARTKV